MPEPDTRPHVVAVCGSLRDRSRTRVVLRDVLTAAEDAGARTTLVDLREYDLPPLKGTDGPTPDADRLREHVAAADSVVLGTPNYHDSFSGVLKNALDYLGRDAFEATTVGLLEVSGGRFPGSAATQLRTVTRMLGGWTLPTEIAVPNASSTVADDGVADAELAGRVQAFGTDLVEYAGGPERDETDSRRLEADADTAAEP